MLAAPKNTLMLQQEPKTSVTSKNQILRQTMTFTGVDQSLQSVQKSQTTDDEEDEDTIVEYRGMKMT